MQIDQMKLTDNVVKNIPDENTNKGIENYIMQTDLQTGIFHTNVETYSKDSDSVSGVSAGGRVNMANATYQKPFSETEQKSVADDLMQGMDMSAEDKKNQMVVAANTTTPEDYQKMMEDGFTLNNSSSQTIITETDKIKAVLAKAGVDISIYGDSLSEEQLKEIIGSEAVARQIEAQMKQNDIPANDSNMSDAQNAYDQATQIGELSEEAIKYLIKNDKEPTISNLYKAQFSSSSQYNTQGMTSSMTDEELQEMSDQIKQMLQSFGMIADDKNIQDGCWLIENGLELNQHNMSYLQQLQGFSISSDNADEIVKSIISAIGEGARPTDAMMLDGYSMKDQAEEAQSIINNATDSDIEYVINHGLTLNIHNLGIAENIRKEYGINNEGSADVTKVNEGNANVTKVNEGNANVTNVKAGNANVTNVKAGPTNINEGNANVTNVKAGPTNINEVRANVTNVKAGPTNINEGNANVTNVKAGSTNINESAQIVDGILADALGINSGAQGQVTQSQIEIISARRALEEVRLVMTSQANYSLLKRGISIDTKPLEMLVNDLKQQEHQYYADLMQQNGVEVTDEKVEKFSNVMSTVEETKWQPAYAINIKSSQDSINTLHENGKAVKADFEKANERYETMMTAPRADLGDNIRKAFRNVDDILADLGMDATEENQRAVRILAYNETEITSENIAKIKAADEEIQRTFKNMTPAVVLEMIREGVQPLDINISQLNDIANRIKENINDDSNEKFNKFLWKLEKNNQISDEERTSYIGIYRLFAQIEKADGASIGAVINQGSEITMRNLLTAVRSNQKGKMDYKVDDDFSGMNAVSNGEKIDDQIMTAYNQNCVRDITDMLTPDNIDAIANQDWENMSPEQIKDILEKTQENVIESDSEYAAEQLEMIEEAASVSEDIYRYLDRYDIQNNVINVIAASRMIKNPNKVFGTLFSEENMSNEDIEKIREIKQKILEKFSEAIKTPEDLATAQEELAEVATHAMDDMIIEDRQATSINVKEMRLASRQLQLASQKSTSESYVIPVETGDGVTGVTLKIVRGKKDKGLVDIFFSTDKMGKVAASFEAKDSGISGIIATSDEETRKLLADNLQMIVSGINDSSDEENEAVDIAVTCVHDLSSEKFEIGSLHKEYSLREDYEQDSKNPVQTKRLYKIAESFIKTIKSYH